MEGFLRFSRAPAEEGVKTRHIAHFEKTKTIKKKMKAGSLGLARAWRSCYTHKREDNRQKHKKPAKQQERQERQSSRLSQQGEFRTDTEEYLPLAMFSKPPCKPHSNKPTPTTKHDLLLFPPQPPHRRSTGCFDKKEDQKEKKRDKVGGTNTKT